MSRNEPSRGRAAGAGAHGGNGAGHVFGTPDNTDTTGRYLVLFREDAVDSAPSLLQNLSGVRIASSREVDAAEVASVEGDGMVFHEIGAAIVTMDPDQLRSVSLDAGAAGQSIVAVEPERYVFAIDEVETPIAREPARRATADIEIELGPLSDLAISRIERDADIAPSIAPSLGTELPLEYLQGYRDSIDHLVDVIGARVQQARAAAVVTPALLTWSEAIAAWGLQAVRATRSRYTGAGVRVAVLDTGFGPHPDFAGRSITLASFVPGQAPTDGHGHGTHTTGTACGPRRPSHLPGYGVAYQSNIFHGKVLSNAGSGTDGQILAGINWAIANGCRVVSMSLGAVTAPGQPFNAVFEGVARRALQRGTLIVAAAGNNAGPVNHPANCPSIMAVAALTDQLQRASFSCRGINPNGGEVNIAAPGVNVYSSWPLAPMYRRLQGTSMATPHVAGVAALLAQATGAAGATLWQKLVQTTRPLGLPVPDVGAGLVQAPL